MAHLQVRHNTANVRPEYIREREVEGKVLPGVEAWHVIAKANRIFGHDGWDRETASTQAGTVSRTLPPSFVREPEDNGVADRFIRTSKENLLWVTTFTRLRVGRGATGIGH